MNKCAKCGYECQGNNKFGLVFCDVCIKFCPDNPDEIDEYIKEKIDSNALDSFRKYAKTRGQNQKKGMIKKALQGQVVSRAPFGYELKDKKLVPTQNSKEVEEIFEEFLEPKTTLNKLSKKHNFSVNGLKKVLTNFTYIGKIKFNNQIFNGNHQPLISSILFNKVQDKLEKIKKRNIIS